MAKGNSRNRPSGEDVTFGSRLRRLREAAGLTQEELAGRAGLTAKAISLLERGVRKRSYAHTSRALAEALGLPDEERAYLIGCRANIGLLTLTGAGGIGKTRLGIEAARKAEGHFPDGVAFVVLAPLGGAALVMPTVLRALGLRGAAGVHPLEILRRYLSRRKCLLVLDNFEHVLEAAPEVVDLLGSCPDLSVLVTSRALEGQGRTRVRRLPPRFARP